MMKNKKLVSAILAAASIAGGVVSVQATTIEGLEAKVNTYTSRVQQAETRIGTLETKVKALDTTGIADNKAGIEANKNAIATQGSQISQLQKDTDKQHWQIDALEKKTGVNTPLTNGATNLSAGVNQNTKLVEEEAKARENADSKLQDQITTNKDAIATQGTQISQLQKDMAQDAMDHAAEMDKLTTKVNQKADKADVEANKNDIASNAAAIKTETQKRENAVNKLQNQVTVATGRLDNVTNKVTQNADAIGTLQQQIKDSGQAFNADQVKQIRTNKDDIETINKELGMGAFNAADGYVVKKDDTIGGALKNLDKNADKQHWQIDALEKKTGVNTPLINGAFSLSDGVNANTGKINENTSKIDANTGKINALDKTVDKQHWQIDALEKKTGVNTPLTNGATNLSAGVNQNTKLLEEEAKARDDADSKLQDQITTNKNAIDKQGADISKLQKDTDKQHWQIDALEKKTGVNTPLTNGATNLSAGVNQNTKLVEDEAKEREKADTQLQANIEKETADRIAGDNALNSRIGQVESDATKGIAKASALAALHPLDYDPDNKFDIAAAGGFYKGENAFALGAFYRPNRNVMLSMGTTLTSGDNAYNVGLTFKIGKSGKHTEAGLTTADLYAMIGAMQDKMDQQQKKIEELEAKQAK